MYNRRDLVRKMLKMSQSTSSDEEMIQRLLEQEVAVDPAAGEKKLTFGQRAADNVARFAGSWGFIFSFLLVMAVWMAINILMAARAFDPYPFILLNLLLSCVAAIQAPLIMMSQNRQEEKDRARAENDYHVNLKSEFIIDELYMHTERILRNQSRIMKALEASGIAVPDVPKPVPVKEAAKPAARSSSRSAAKTAEKGTSVAGA